MVIALPVLAGGLGLLVGSFLNVVAHRVPHGRSILAPGSACPACGAGVRAIDNIPVISWLRLGGRCRSCRSPISVRYPLVEASTAALFAVTAAVIGWSWVLPAFLWFVGVSWVLVFTDLDHKRIPNAILYPGTAVGIGLLAAGSAVENNWGELRRGLVSGLVVFGMFFLLALVARGGFGFGDVKLGFLLGLFAGYRSADAVVAGLFMAFLLGGLVSLGLLITRKKGRRDAIPFGPFLVIGTYLGICFGESLMRSYLS